MKKKGAIAEYSQERLEDLMRVYNKYISLYKNVRMTEIYNIVANSPAQRFWVSEKRAAVVIYDIIKGNDPLKKMIPTKRMMFEEIYSRVMKLREEKPDLSISKLCEIVTAQPAPCFYLTPNTIEMFFSIAKGKKRKKQE